MNSPSTTLLAEAARLHQAGQLAEAEARYRQALTAAPDDANALHLLGVIAHQRGRHEEALALISKAAALRPNAAEYRNNAGLVLTKLGRNEEAVAAFRTAVQLKAYPEAYRNLGAALRRAGRLDEAAAALHEAIRLKPDYSDAYGNLRDVLLAQGRIPEAVTAQRESVRLAPASAQAHLRLAVTLRRAGQMEEAIATCRTALELAPPSVEARNELAVLLHATGHSRDALTELERAISLQPDFAEAHYTLGLVLHTLGEVAASANALLAALKLQPSSVKALNQLSIVLRTLGRVDEAIDIARRGVELEPGNSYLQNTLAAALKDAGDVAAALSHYRRSCELDPDRSLPHQNILLASHYADFEPRVLFEEHRRWAQRFAAPMAPPSALPRDPLNAGRPLRVGYLSPDFRTHSVARFVLPLFRAHDRTAVQIYAYSDVERPDEITAALKSCCHAWRDLAGLSDEKVANLIRGDRLDILVDLAGHTARNRLLVFARRPAPVQITWLGYPDTTGLATMDYRLTDAIADPPGETDHLHTERLLRLPHPAWCFTPPDEAPLPAVRSCQKPFRFASFAYAAKTSDRTLELWARVLTAAPQAELALKSVPPLGVTARERILRAFARHAIVPERILFIPSEQDFGTHMTAYNEIDAVLDTFPYHGTTTTCEALWMGRPVITLTGPTHVSRVGTSLLTAIGLPELAADRAERFVQIAAELAAARDQVTAWHATLRQQMASSPLMDAPRFARRVEAAYRLTQETDRQFGDSP